MNIINIFSFMWGGRKDSNKIKGKNNNQSANSSSIEENDNTGKLHLNALRDDISTLRKLVEMLVEKESKDLSHTLKTATEETDIPYKVFLKLQSFVPINVSSNTKTLTAKKLPVPDSNFIYMQAFAQKGAQINRHQHSDAWEIIEVENGKMRELSSGYILKKWDRKVIKPGTPHGYEFLEKTDYIVIIKPI